ncbi:MAG: hypothetical protein EAZ37_13300 [Burkholderiales bacterium]|nr:MAG: hypothetical protein EAZ37_13300 [Burkholderiales bacterium]
MKTTIFPPAIALVLVFLTGCASAPQKQVLSVQEKADYAQRIARIKSVDILYSNDNHVVVLDGGGSGSVGMAGLLGPVGLLAAVAIDGASKLSKEERSKARSKEFSDKVRSELPSANLSKDFADQVASKLRDRGMEVTVTPLTSSRTSADLATYPELANIAAGRAAVVIWNNPGLTAESATSAYVTSAVIDYYCADADKTKILDGRIVRRGDSVARTFQGLMDPISQTYSSLRTLYLSGHINIVQQCFDVPDEKRPIDVLKSIAK